MPPTNNLPYFPFHVDDYLNDPAVVLMDADAEGCYLRLLLRSWRSPTPGRIDVRIIYNLSDGWRLVDQYRLLCDNKRIPLHETPSVDPDQVALERWRDVEAQLAQAFDTTDPEAWVQKRMMAEHRRAQSLTNARRRGGRNRWKDKSLRADLKDTTTTPQGNVDVDLDLDLESTDTPNTCPPVGGRVGGSPAAHSKPDPKAEWLQAFTEDFYPDYPHKAKPDDARKAWLQMKPWSQDNCDTIFAGLELWRAWWTEQETPKDKIPYPATFLRSGQWKEAPQ